MNESTPEQGDSLVREHFADRMLMSIGRYQDGEKTGEWKYYDPTGKLIRAKVY